MKYFKLDVKKRRSFFKENINEQNNKNKKLKYKKIKTFLYYFCETTLHL